MLFITIKVVLLLGSIVVPLSAQKNAPKPHIKFKIDTDTKNANYAINAKGLLEKIHRTSMTDQVDL